MGMAASQARFLGLTARKNNLEFEGQQINQQRTTLANQSANYYNDLLGMSVPTPPSVDNFTKTVYTFNDGAMTNQITAMIAQGNGLYTLSYLAQWEDDFSPVSAATSVVNIAAEDTYMVGSNTLRDMGASRDSYPSISRSADGRYSGTPADEYLSTLSKDQLDRLEEEEKYYIDILNDKYGTPEKGWMIRYIKNTSSGTWQPFFYNKDDIAGANAVKEDTNDAIISSVKCYTIGSATTTEEVKGVKDCRVEKDSTGRYIAVAIPQLNSAGEKIGETLYSLTTTTMTDQEKYDDAMNQYEYEKYQYDQAVQEINAKIEIVQAQDKNLELRLKQLDTEQNALKTEMDAVSKIVKDNVEDTFKTFGG